MSKPQTFDAIAFYSNIIQVSSTIVAIFGGFLISRIISNRSSASDLKHQIDVLKHEREHYELERMDLFVARLNIFKSIAFERWVKNPDVLLGNSDGKFMAELLEDLNDHRINVNKLVEEFVNEAKIVSQLIEEDLDRNFPKITDEWRKDKNIDSDDRKTSIANAIAEKISHDSRQRMGTNFQIGPSWTKNISFDHLKIFGIDYAGNVSGEIALENKIQFLDGKIEILQSQLTKIENENNPTGIFIGLGGLTILGILAPLIVIRLFPYFDHMLASSIILALLILGFGLALVNVFYKNRKSQKID